MSASFHTPDTARRALDVVRPAVEKVRRIYRALERAHSDAFHEDGPVSAGYYRAVLALERIVIRLTRIGAVVEDPGRGLVVFPARRDGREVVLCWRPDDPSVAYWRDPADDAPSRRPIDDDGPWEKGDTPLFRDS